MEPIGLKVVTAGGWFAARPSGTEKFTKFMQSFGDQTDLNYFWRGPQL
jgi:phosphoglucomutase